ncbi:hypothetical protein SAMN06265365_15410 [Tistlia consotensis]|uniref:Capsule biosynthesis protein n=1 Tax=Tistlia consotensis USBA 355 TaxID=560819 RepID=A0A1Y6CX06_9PROT|nr:DUF6356 family protein [Tistlia consotensis]SMF84482.1 hypothetical protein SAMN05428998_1566 [Tistlia consotensis USBA 355]SNS36497.1 hypothetical protein SAMN06265365_15410 [Tistlia consotensis]
MKAIVAAFTDHPAAVGESYGEHFAFASGIGVKLLAAGGAALLHALFPFLFKTTASGIVLELARSCGPRNAASRR